MSKVEISLVEEGLAEIERMIEQEIGDKQGIAAATLRLVVDEIGGRIRRAHPRFPVGGFETRSLPIQTERIKQTILSKVQEAR